MEKQVLLTGLCLAPCSPVPTLMPLSWLLLPKIPDWILKTIGGLIVLQHFSMQVQAAVLILQVLEVMVLCLYYC